MLGIFMFLLLSPDFFKINLFQSNIRVSSDLETDGADKVRRSVDPDLDPNVISRRQQKSPLASKILCLFGLFSYFVYIKSMLDK